MPKLTALEVGVEVNQGRPGGVCEWGYESDGIGPSIGIEPSRMVVRWHYWQEKRLIHMGVEVAAVSSALIVVVLIYKIPL